jgi:protein-L-isoaspartate(D-aspartate) O-methyltransferase
MAELPRAAFVPAGLEASAYLDQPIPISHRQVTTQPSLVAKMVEALALRGGEKVLEVGTGLGYQTALLARLAREVWSVELWEDMRSMAAEALRGQGIANVELMLGDGTLGLAEQAPFDAIVVTAAFGEVPEPLVEQLVPGGRLVQPIGPGGYEEVVLFVKGDSGLEARRMLTGARFVRLYGEHGYPLDQASAEP